MTLTAAVRKIGAIDLVLTGRQAADDDNGIVGAGIGELLGIAVICFAKEVEIIDSTVRVERVLDDGTEIVEAALPAVVTVSNEIGDARKPTLRETMRAARKPLVQWGAAELGIGAEAAAEARCCVERVYAPVKENRCELIAGDSAREQAVALVQHLRSAKLI
jgi:electron transfer flavoprotein beta subunit